ncbi:MAG TPA: hypothetical protein DEA22_05335 [Blastocatellia bacterium]|nr:hypothetical protein [Blastocatellia bacterium]
MEELNKMLGKNLIRKSITLFSLTAILTVYSMAVLAANGDAVGQITVTGQVTVNGQNAVSDSTIFSGSTIVTGSGSRAIVSLGKAGRIEIGAHSNFVLNFSENSIVGILGTGSVRALPAAGIATSITTKDAVVIADAAQANNFLVETECSHTHVDTTAGYVTMREGTADRQVAAGSSATAGSLSQTGCKPCLRPDSAPPVRIGGPWWLLFGAIPLFFLGSDDPPRTPGEVIVVSPLR